MAPRRRLYVLALLLALWGLAVCFRLIQLQVFRYGEFLQRAQRQQTRTIDVEPRRGNVYDRNGNALAMSIDVDSVFAVPGQMPDKETSANILAQVLHMEAPEILAHLNASRSFAWVARKVDAETSNRVRALNLRGVYFQKEPKRFYPKRELLSQTLGYVGLDGEGLGGLEREFNDDLQGIPGKELISIDARRQLYDRVEKQPDPGQNLVLTIDSTIQYIAERELDQAMEETKAVAGTVVIQNPHTGEILALANRPTFNPNVFNSVPPEALKNRAVSDVYEPGSVFKIVTYSAAFEQHLARPEEMIDCQNGSIDVFGMKIRDHEKLGVITISEALAHSSDVAAIKVGMRLGPERFDHYIRDYGFGAQTGIELPGETRGLAKPWNRWSKVSIGAISMGQEIGVTPLQTISMISTIANDGVYTPPRIVAGELPPNGIPKPVVFHHAQQRRVISTITAAQMKKMMEGVVLFGTARRAILDGYTSAGKTGTAQKVDPATGTYSKTKYVGSFVGFAPVNNPALTVEVVLDSAQGLHQGGQVSAPVFKRIAQQVLEYMHVPHDTEITNPAQRALLRAAVKDEDVSEGDPDRLGAPPLMSDAYANGNVRPQSAKAAAPAAKVPADSSSSLIPDASAASALRAQTSQTARMSPVPAKDETSAGSTVVLDVDSGPVVPSFLGKTLRASVEVAQQSGLEMSAIGSGIAREQSPLPGTHLASGQRVTVRFSH
jgi:cell division protein FtsI (penicillin-binding protein 3)